MRIRPLGLLEKAFMAPAFLALAFVAGCGAPANQLEKKGLSPASTIATAMPPATAGSGTEDEDSVLNLSNFHPQRLTAAQPQLPPSLAAAAGTCNGAAQPSLDLIRPARPSRNLPLFFSASDGAIVSGQGTVLSWSSPGAGYVEIAGIGKFGRAGSIFVNPASTTTYRAIAHNELDGSPAPEQALSILVDPQAPLVDAAIVVHPQKIVPGTSAVLQWWTSNADSVTIAPAIGAVANSGAVVVQPAATTTYTVTASCGNTSVSRQVTLPVAPAAGVEKLSHIIYMLQENRSFDHYFGKLGDYRVAQGLPREIDGLSTFSASSNLAANSNKNEQGNPISSYKLQTQCIEGLSAAWNESHWHFNLFNPTSNVPVMDGFVATAQGYARFLNLNDTAGLRAMGYYDQTDLPYYYFMATQFATSDRFFSPIPARSEPSRLYALAGTSAGFSGRPTATLNNTKTIFQLLEENGHTWKLYYSDVYPDGPNAGKPITALDTFFNFAEAHRNLIVPVSQYFIDVQNGTLPEVAFIEHGSASGRDEHPGGAKIQEGAHYVGSIINALMASTSWPSSVFILSYDEGGGLFDHVPPVTNLPSPDGIAPTDLTAQDITGDFTRTGMRVPVIVVSPFTRKNYVSHTFMDYTAILKLIETRHGLPSLTARDAYQPDMLEFFDFAAPPWSVPPTPPVQPTSEPCYMNQLP